MTRPIAEYSDPEDWLRDLRENVAQLRERTEKAAEAVANITGEGTAANGGVKVKLGHHARLESVQINDEAYRLGPTKLGSAVVMAFRRAQAAMMESAEAASAMMIGEDRAREFIERYRLPEEDLDEAEDAAGQAPVVRPAPEGHDEEDDDDPGRRFRGGILR